MKKTIIIYILSVTSLAASLLACAPASNLVREAAVQTPALQSRQLQVTGVVRFPKPAIALPLGAQIKVMLVDVSVMDVAHVVIHQQTHDIKASHDLPFIMTYDASQIKASGRYAVSARIEHLGKLLYINDTHTGVIYNGRLKDVVLEVVRVKH